MVALGCRGDEARLGGEKRGRGEESRRLAVKVRDYEIVMWRVYLLRAEDDGGGTP